MSSLPDLSQLSLRTESVACGDYQAEDAIDLALPALFDDGVPRVRVGKERRRLTGISFDAFRPVIGRNDTFQVSLMLSMTHQGFDRVERLTFVVSPSDNMDTPYEARFLADRSTRDLNVKHFSPGARKMMLHEPPPDVNSMYASTADAAQIYKAILIAIGIYPKGYDVLRTSKDMDWESKRNSERESQWARLPDDWK